ncbi:DUF6090 family protein [Winogradskyella alexanderae]|uniref:Uncharacterized protein n=1 Tax=Winogradskyella alexanderae TaxID=2877123 RepID=A0ABS7XWG2_9FLAO|nr:DUF6090 family protein [Winogradskyella alexanderae]MCA0133799.1 hypothetical protein [Winogradskyella alexanderae]
MIKFFRQIRYNFLKENNMGKYLKYAIGEIILVVIGILIALQVNNSNENRKKKVQERVFLEQLHDDFEANQEAISSYKMLYDINRKHLDVILRHTGPKVEVPPAAVFDSIQSLNSPQVELLYATNDTQSGLSFDLLSNSTLKQTIKQFPIVFKLYQSDEAELNELLLQQRKIHQRYVPLTAMMKRRYKQEHFKVDSLGLIRDMQFQNITADRLWVSNAAERRFVQVETYNDSIVKLIETELKKYD